MNWYKALGFTGLLKNKVSLGLFASKLYMSPIYPVFHTAATVNIGLKNILRVETFSLQFYMSML